MRFKKGSSVEVLSKDELPSGSWRCAEVVCGNGHNYTVQYKSDNGSSNDLQVERVSRKSIRPSPPSVKLPENWVRGDVLEVFQNYSWKMATVCEVLGRNVFLVRLVGFSHEYRVSRSDLRVRQSWQDGQWFVIGKNIENCDELEKANGRLFTKYNGITRAERLVSPYDGFYAARNTTESHSISLRNRKRGICYADSVVEVPAKRSRKFKETEKVVTSAVLNNRKAQFTNLVLERDYDEDTITCSVGSCSINSNDLYKSCSYFPRGPIDDECSDAESVCYGDSKEGILLQKKKECFGEIRRLELDAYRRTMEALHACGPLSWEQETLVTNLRLSLNISNDQHLIELRHLASTTSSPSLR